MLRKLVRNFTISPLDNRYASKTKPLDAIFSEKAFVGFRIKTEIAWLKKLAKEGIIKEEKMGCSAGDLPSRLERFDKFSDADFEKFKAIEATTNHDVKAIEYFVKQELAQLGFAPAFREYTHLLCTSEDINNIAYSLMMQEFKKNVYMPALASLVARLNLIAQRHKDLTMLSLTHGQPATPTTLGKEIANFAFRLNRQREMMQEMIFWAKMNGATGNFNAHYVVYPEIDWRQLINSFLEDELNLVFNQFTTQIEPHDSLCEFLTRMGHANTIGIGFCQDMWGYITREYFHIQVKKDEVGSSIMPHKVNPIDFENAEGNFGVANGLIEHFCRKLPISRFQRDLSDSTVMRNLGVAAGHTMLALQSLETGLNKLTVNKQRVSEDVASNVELLAEPIQQLLRSHGFENAYEMMKDLTRGQKVTVEKLRDFVQGLDVPAHVKQRIESLDPSTYRGQAEELVQFLDRILSNDEDVMRHILRLKKSRANFC